MQAEKDIMIKRHADQLEAIQQQQKKELHNLVQQHKAQLESIKRQHLMELHVFEMRDQISSGLNSM